MGIFSFRYRFLKETLSSGLVCRLLNICAYKLIVKYHNFLLFITLESYHGYAKLNNSISGANPY